MKYHNYKPIMLLAFIFFMNTSKSQTFSFVYKISYSTVFNNNEMTFRSDSLDTASINTFKDFFKRLPLKIYATYNIISDGKYMLIEGNIDSSFSSGFSLHFSGQKEVIDLKNRLVYSPDEKSLQKIKVYSLKNGIDQQSECLKKFIEGKTSNFEVKICKKIPKSILFPQVLFTNAEYGIQSIHSPEFEVELLSYKRIKEDKRLLDCKKYFHSKPLSEKEFDFFEQ